MARTKSAPVDSSSPKGSIPRERSLPKKRNHLLSGDQTPSYDELVSKRRLGRTDLQVKAEQVGTTNATKKENLGSIEYAYLGAPLPENLKGSEVFKPTANAPTPSEYFMMRRSKDGFVSATGMFKVAFPWAKEAEEEAEREYLRTLATTSADEQAGNIWINEVAALELSDDYHIKSWIVALLDSAPMIPEPHKAKYDITAPPAFEFKAGGSNGAAPELAPLASPNAKGSKRGKRSQSPSKTASSPRKRVTKAMKEAGAHAAKAASATLQNALDTAASVADSESVVGESDAPKINGASDIVMDAATDRVTVQVESTVETNGDVETTHTNVKVQMPADSPELPLPETTEQMIETAKQMVEEARKLEVQGENEAAHKSNNKRKVGEIDEEADDELAVEASEGRELKPAKKARLMEQEMRTQRVRSRALMGVAATLTIGAIIPYFIGA